MRIISTVPSITELLYDLELDESVVGITKFCIHPEKWSHSKTKVGGTKTLHIQTIRDLQPSLIIANKEENTKEQIDQCREFCEVYVNDVATFDDALEMIVTVGKLTNSQKKAADLINQIKHAFSQLPFPKEPAEKVVYLIWKDPLMTVGNDTFIHDMICRAGWENIFSDQERYPQITEQQLEALKPDAVFLSSEPYPFSDKHRPYFQQLLPDSKIITVDGEMFSWYGSRMRLAPEYFKTLIKQAIE